MNHNRATTNSLEVISNFDDTGRAFLAEGSIGTSESFLGNAVLPPEFNLSVPTRAPKRKWEFTDRNPVPFARAWQAMKNQLVHQTQRP
jgi:hypothetical protein